MEKRNDLRIQQNNGQTIVIPTFQAETVFLTYALLCYLGEARAITCAMSDDFKDVRSQ